MKVKNYTTFWVLSILYLISVFGANYISYQFWDARPKKSDMTDSIIGNPFNFPEVWHMVTFTSSFLMIMPGLLIIISVTNEYSYKTHRQNIIDGWSRKDFILVKIMLSLVVAFIATIAVFITALVFGWVLSETSISFEKVEYLFYFFIQAASYCGVALLFSLLFKRSGITLGIYFLYAIVIENMLAGILNRYANNLGRYLPLETTDNLIRVPVFKVIVNQLVAPYNLTALLIMSAVYLTLYYIISIWRFTTEDL